jgi:Predicted membrane protein
LDSDAFALVPALALGYYLLVRHTRVERWRIACFTLALVLLAAVFATPLDTLALNYLLTAHLLQNVVVAAWAPALLVLGLPSQLGRRRTSQSSRTRGLGRSRRRRPRRPASLCSLVRSMRVT